MTEFTGAVNVRKQASATNTDPFAFDRGPEGKAGAPAPDGNDLSRERCIELLETIPIGRIGFTTDDGPLVLPVNYAWFEGSIVFRSLDGQKMAAATEGQVVCFEVDEWDADTRSGWSVVVRGPAREVTQWAEREQLENLQLVPWARDVWRPLWIRVDAAEVTGRTLRPST